MSACAALAFAPAFLYVPQAVGELLSSDFTSARAGAGFLAERPSLALSTYTHVLLGTGIGALVACWSVLHVRPERVWRTLRVLMVALLVVALGHALGGHRALFGLLAPVEVGNRAFFAPFINPNHFATVAVLAFAFWADLAVRLQDPFSRALHALVALGFVAAIVLTGSVGAVVGLAGVLLVLVARHRALKWLLVAVPLGAMAGVPIVWRMLDADVWKQAGVRADIWSSALALWWAQPVFGSGAGSFEDAVAPFRTDSHYTLWRHAHSDPLEWLATTGAIGVVVGALALPPLLRRGEARSGAEWVPAGLVGVALHASVDFPLQVGAIWMLVAASWAFWLARSTMTPRLPTRALVVALALVQLAAGLWKLRDWGVGRAIERGDADTLSMLDPGHPSLGGMQMEAAARAGDLDVAWGAAETWVARYPGRADVLRPAAEVALMRGDLDTAVAWAERAAVRGPADWRNWRLRAEVVTRVDPVRGPEVWADALRHGARGALQRGWLVLPIGLFWADAAQQAPIPTRRRVAKFLIEKKDLEGAGFVLDSILVETPDAWLPEVVVVAKALGEDERALAYLERMAAVHADDANVHTVRARTCDQLSADVCAHTEWTWLAERNQPGAAARLVELTRSSEGERAALAVCDRYWAGRDGALALQKVKLLAAMGDSKECVELALREQVWHALSADERQRRIRSECGIARD